MNVSQLDNSKSNLKRSSGVKKITRPEFRIIVASGDYLAKCLYHNKGDKVIRSDFCPLMLGHTNGTYGRTIYLNPALLDNVNVLLHQRIPSGEFVLTSAKHYLYIIKEKSCFTFW